MASIRSGRSANDELVVDEVAAFNSGPLLTPAQLVSDHAAIVVD
jgi:hypothetical protein